MKKHLSLLSLAFFAASLTKAQTLTPPTNPGELNLATVYNQQEQSTTRELRTVNDRSRSAYVNSNATASRASVKPAEYPSDKPARFGAYAGLSASRFAHEPIPDDSYRAGWQAGLYFRSGGIIFGQLGVEYRNASVNLIRADNTTSNPLKGNLNQHFLVIPGYAGVRVGGTLGLRVQIGAEYSTLMGVGSNNFNLSKDNLKTTTVNGLLDLGLNLGPVTVDVFYSHGFTNVFTDNTLDSKRRMAGLNLGLRF